MFVCVCGSVSGLFSDGIEIYCGYVDDPRNTDHAWMETKCVWKDVTESELAELQLKFRGGDDAEEAKWWDMNALPSDLYANHMDFLEIVRTILNWN